VRITKGKWEGTKEQDFFDKATMSVLVGSKYKSLTRLSTGERNAAMMVLLMNQGAFGPLIIDEPEQYLDVKSITGMLIPRMRKLKTKQQIICVTRDEHILVSGDAEQVIATQSEEKLEVITGDINKKDIQEHVIEIFEGDKYALLEKSRKLGRILE
jgi:ATPase subunit of ABC transporter with duplicated ATPase domains